MAVTDPYTCALLSRTQHVPLSAPVQVGRVALGEGPGARWVVQCAVTAPGKVDAVAMW